jgi:hypothetical protein
MECAKTDRESGLADRPAWRSLLNASDNGVTDVLAIGERKRRADDARDALANAWHERDNGLGIGRDSFCIGDILLEVIQNSLVDPISISDRIGQLQTATDCEIERGFQWRPDHWNLSNPIPDNSRPLANDMGSRMDGTSGGFNRVSNERRK